MSGHGRLCFRNPTARNFLLAERSRTPGVGGIHGGERRYLFGNPIRFAARQERKVNCFCASVSANVFDADLAAETCHSAVVA